MKKTLIALAVLAASGASFAQVAITGNLTMGYNARTTGGAASNDASGFGTDTSEIDFMATEDLGSGWKATAKMALAGADRSGESGNGTVNGRNASLGLTTPLGLLTLASVSAPDYLSTIASTGAYYNNFDKKIFSARSNRDVVAFSVPVGPVVLGVSYQEDSTSYNQGLGVGTTGLGGPGAAATGVTPATAAVQSTGQSLTTYGATYNAGPIAANFTYLNFNAKVNGVKDQTRLSGAYDLGVAKLGAGVVVTNRDATALAVPAPKITDLLLGVSAPMGALTIGANIGQRRFDDSAAAGLTVKDGSVNGTALQISYALSKRTSLIANYARWDSAVGAVNASTDYNLLLSHSF